MSSSFDIALFENDNGGDILVKGNDLVKYFENEGQVYLALFGGNVEESTSLVNIVGKERFDYWGNYYLSVDNQFNSRTERTLNASALSSQGRGEIQSAIEYDLMHMKQFSNVTVTVTLEGVNRIRISIITAYFTGRKTLTTAIYVANSSTGDFYLLDFSSQDFY
jgi:hypothetical protein